ncbi:MAG: type II restriction endonuclease, partial [Fusobacterium mortiferum]
MNIENKQRIIDNLFENKFNLDNFKEFVANILNFRVENNEESPKIFATFLSYIISYQVISNYTDIEKNKMTVMCVKIKEDKDPIRARVKQREFIAKLLRNSSKDGALVVFYNEDSLHWRMSFIRLNYEFTMKGIEERITPAKRLSYVVGEGEACKTAKDQFYTLANLKESISLNKLEEVFALEKVTKDFFEEYKDKYEEIKKILIDDKNFMAEARKHESEKPESFADGFTKKLMGQISFIYFLQKKGWLGIKIIPESMNLENFNKFYKSASEKGKTILTKIYEREEQDLFLLNKEKMKKLNNKIDGEILARIFINSEFFNEWGTGDKKFLKTLFNNHLEQDKDNGKTFFEDYLEILFYNNLSEDRGELQYSIDFNSRIPFLNGGLFDPYGNYDWDKTSFNLNDELFYNGKDGILDIFDRYNFTINENDSYETEVAVDPEMLGKVFENLLDISEKKSKGAFYTPREIVRYMTNESIINYLLANLKDTNIKKEELDYLFNLGEFSKEYDLQKFEQDFLKHGIPLKDEKGKPQLDMKRNIIINCKKIDDLLKKVKIADPACGSGAFPLGLLNEIVRARNVLTFYINMTEFFKEKEKEKKKYWKRKFESDEKRSLYNLKLETIQNC